MKAEATWHGTPEQAVDLANAVANNCECEFSNLGVCVAICCAHAMMEDQRTLDALAFGRYMAERLVAQEFDTVQVVDVLGSTQAA